MADNEILGNIRRAVEHEMERANIGAKPLAKKAGIGETVVRDLVKGMTKDVQLGTLEKIAAALSIPVARLLPIADDFRDVGPRLWVKGEVAAGVWREAVEWPEDDWQHFTGRSDVAADAEHRFGLRVVGDSMNEIYPHGTIVECVSVFGRSEIVPGKRVVVIRQRDDHECEATVKELVEQDGKLWLVPRSTNPAFRSFPLDENEPGIIETRIAAVVVASIRPE